MKKSVLSFAIIGSSVSALALPKTGVSVAEVFEPSDLAEIALTCAPVEEGWVSQQGGGGMIYSYTLTYYKKGWLLGESASVKRALKGRCESTRKSIADRIAKAIENGESLRLFYDPANKID